MKRKDRDYLRDIADSLDLIEDFTKGRSLVDFQENIMMRDAVLMRFGIIGEAVKNLSDEVKSKSSETPWREIAGLRDVVIHRYFGIDLERIWRFICQDLPVFKVMIENLLKQTDDQK